MAITQTSETDIKKLVEQASAEVKEDKVIPWIIDHSVYWRAQGYIAIKKAIADLDNNVEG